MMEIGCGAGGKAMALPTTTMAKPIKVFGCSALQACSASNLVYFSPATLHNIHKPDLSSIAVPVQRGLGVDGPLACKWLTLLTGVQVSG